ncbi:protochlorophyllide-dependent translocon component 52, chloroplastic-like isoform X2 [Humulus lupulus]|uniref:protochlorophyllide-dependent translocon component 52, chloroplastic-like isoform X2 n=1 Tax=Humulus lupulus TaxID=3486 RepID=UPI002B406B04|nr:protochlorophyllide-dependent translocon component 52, chloroplastic-like isoform X2 [Humulus lupulus]
MVALRATPTLHSLPNAIPSRLDKKLFHSNFNQIPPTSSFSFGERTTVSRSKLFTSISSSVSTDLTDPFQPAVETQNPDEKFDWYSNWCPIMPVCDLDKRRPHGKKVMGLDVVVWWDKNESVWKVFDDSCPHRLAPLSEGRIDQWGRLQCVYHGWCFNGSGNCKFIPQAPPDGPPVHTSKRACVSVYPSTVQNGIVWFWPNTDPKYKNIIMKKKPPYIAEIDDPSYAQSALINRDLPYGYEVMIENLMDPAHVPYAHYGLMQTRLPGKADREGGIPLEMTLESFNPNGFTGMGDPGFNQFFAPYVFYSSMPVKLDQDNETKKGFQKRMALVFICVPISPGKSRLIFSGSTPTFHRYFARWFNKIFPRWITHAAINTVLDSDAYLLHLEERKIMDAGVGQWHKACFVPAKTDAHVVAFRKWLNKYGGGQVDWRGKFSGVLPPTPPREQLMDRYWSHVVNCGSCKAAYKGFKVLEVVLQVISITLIGYAAATKQGQALKIAIVSIALLSFVASKWLSHLIYKIFHYHGYDHAFR